MAYVSECEVRGSMGKEGECESRFLKNFFFQIPGFSVVKIAGCTLYMRYIYLSFSLYQQQGAKYIQVYTISLLTILVNGLPQSICKKNRMSFLKIYDYIICVCMM